MVNYTPKTQGKDKSTPEILVKDILTAKFPTINCDSEITEAISILIKNKTSGLVVMNEKSEAVGFLSEKDCLQLVHSMKYYNTVSDKVSDYMSKFLVTLTPEADIYEAVEIFTKYYFHIIPVMQGQKVVGIVKRHEVLKAMDKLVHTTW